MPSRSIAQQHAMAAAEHGADFPLATRLRASLSHAQLHEFAATRTKGLPAHAHAHAHASLEHLIAHKAMHR